MSIFALNRRHGDDRNLQTVRAINAGLVNELDGLRRQLEEANKTAGCARLQLAIEAARHVDTLESLRVMSLDNERLTFIVESYKRLFWNASDQPMPGITDKGEE